MRLLVVEDEPRISDGIKTALDGAGYACDVAADGEDAWFRGDTETYDLVVLDLGLPKLDGLSVLKRWRAAGRNMPVLVLTARGAWPERVEGIDAGADDYLAKPFRTEELLARVRALIRRSVGQSNAVMRSGQPQPRYAADAHPCRRRGRAGIPARIPAHRLSRCITRGAWCRRTS